MVRISIIHNSPNGVRTKIGVRAPQKTDLKLHPTKQKYMNGTTNVRQDKRIRSRQARREDIRHHISRFQTFTILHIVM